MLKSTWMFVLLFTCFTFSVCGSGEKPISVQVTIESPQQGAEVELAQLVKGKVSDPKVDVYVLVHPLLANLWWVQRRPSPPGKDGAWQTTCYFGTETQGVGESFELVAIASSKTYEEGQTLKELPKDASRSDIITVKRTR